MTDETTTNCGTCGYAYRVREGHCQNPVCAANPAVPRARIDELARQHAEATRQRREDERRRALWGSSFRRQ